MLFASPLGALGLKDDRVEVDYSVAVCYCILIVQHDQCPGYF